MRILAITLRSFEEQARRIAGARADVVTAPGITVWPKGVWYDMLMIWLHPAADGQAWVDENGATVLSVEQVRDLPLRDAVVFVGACYGTENRALITALFEAGARAVIAGPGRNFGGRDGLAGADVLALALRKGLALGLRPALAWRLARAAGRLARLRGAAGVGDALAYELMLRDDTAALDGCRRQWAAVIGFVIMLVTLLFGQYATRELITFDSPISPPPTSQPTYTPWYTPGGWGSAPEFATPTVCVGVGCDPTPGARITYDLYLPVVMCNWSAE